MVSELYDDDADDAFDVGDASIVATRTEMLRVETAFTVARAKPRGDDRNFAVLGVLHEMYGDDLEVL